MKSRRGGRSQEAASSKEEDRLLSHRTGRGPGGSSPKVERLRCHVPVADWAGLERGLGRCANSDGAAAANSTILLVQALTLSIGHIFPLFIISDSPKYFATVP